MKENLQSQISKLKHEIKIELDALIARRTEYSDLEIAFTNISSNLKTSHETLSSFKLCVPQDIPSSFEQMKKELEEVEMQKIANMKILQILDSIDVGRLRCGRENFQYPIEYQIASHKNFGQMCDCELSQHISLIHKNLDNLPDFEKKCMYLIKWCEKIQYKISEEFTISPANALSKLNNIEMEINNMKSVFDDAINLGNSLLDNEDFLNNVTEKISSLNSVLSQTEHLHAQRLQTLRKIIDCIESIDKDTEKLNHFLISSESSVESSLHLKDIPYQEIDEKLSNIQALENEVEVFQEVVSNIQRHRTQLDSYAVNFNNVFIRNILQYSLNSLHRWIPFKEIVTEQRLSLQNIKSKWDEFLIALEKLEKWLIYKEDIAFKINYSDPGHSKNTYLDGLGVFEKLNHCFQDDIQMLHSVNTSFHNISKNEFNISNTLKNRVMTANDQWHKLYKRVVEIFGTLKNILQIWDDFDQLKEHLLLFLTETDLKLTEMEAIGSFIQTSYENFEEDFKLHVDKKERFIATAKHLMKQSECSTCIIQESVDEIENYWKELYNRIQSLRKTLMHPVEKKESTKQYSEQTIQSEIKCDASKNENVKELENTSTSVDEGSSSLHKDVHLKSEIPANIDYKQSELTYSEVVAMSSEKRDDDVLTKRVTETSVTDSASEMKTKVYSQEHTVLQSTKVRQTSFDDDCTKDLLAALKEAEERMDSLEKVLSELTPSGIDEQGPNYSHLLAACRSSVDVIQHLSQFLFYDVPPDSDRSGKEEIKLQSEDMLERWQRLENMALNKESRVLDNRKVWENFTTELKGFETWVQKALQDYSIQSCTDADIEKLVILLQKHKELISQIRAQKKIILTLNLTGQQLLSASGDNVKTDSLKQRIKTVNNHWDNLYSTALLWQSKLLSEFVQSSEFRSTVDEMKLWLQESEKRIDEMSQLKERTEVVLHEHHTELYALKQQLEVYCNRLETLLEITLHLFLPELHSDENLSVPEESLTALQTELKSDLKISQSLLIKCTEMLKSTSSLLGFSKFREHTSQSRNGAAAISQSDSRSADNTECCSFLMRVARASFPIQAILLLLLGAAILLPMEEEEELSCRLSNNFAASLNPMLRYPDGPPPV